MPCRAGDLALGDSTLSVQDILKATQIDDAFSKSDSEQSLASSNRPTGKRLLHDRCSTIGLWTKCNGSSRIPAMHAMSALNTHLSVMLGKIILLAARHALRHSRRPSCLVFWCLRTQCQNGSSDGSAKTSGMPREFRMQCAESRRYNVHSANFGRWH